jgi:hypothetical protein
MGGVNKYNLDGSKGIIAIETNRGNYITNDWDYWGLLQSDNGWEIYTLEEYENLKKSAQDFAVDILTKERECYFDDLDVEIVAEAYIEGYHERNQNRCLETKPKFKVGDKVKDKNNRVWFIVRVGETFFDISSVPNASDGSEVTGYFVPIEDQDYYELVPQCFSNDI